MNKVVSLLILTVILMLPVAAQQAERLTLDKSVQLALERNVQVVTARNSLQGSQSATRAAVGGLLPNLNFSAGYSRNQTGGNVIVDGVPFAAADVNHSYSTGLSSRVTIFDGFANVANVRRARASEQTNEYSVDRTEQNIVFQTHQQYLDVVRTFQLLNVNEENLKRSRRQLERITESNKVGAVALADVYRQQVQAGSDELALIQAQNNHENAKADLLAFLGVNFDREFEFDFSGIPVDIDTNEFRQVNAQFADFTAMVAQAVAARPDYLGAQSQLNQTQASARMARAARYPNLNAFASYGYNNSEISKLTDVSNFRFGLDVSFPIFTGFQTESQIEQAEVQRRNAEEQLRQNERQVTVDLRKALLNLEASEKQVSVTQSSVASAEMDRKIAEEKYNLGSGTLLDLLIANANYSAALSNKVNAVNNYLLAKKGMEYALGTISK